MAQLGPWFCDHCDLPIEEAKKGYTLWRNDRDRGRYDFKIIHRSRCDDRSYPSSMDLEHFLGVDGLTDLLSFLSSGPLKRSMGEDTTTRGVVSLDEYVDFVRRLQIPGYEQARRRFADEDVKERFADAHEYYPYTQEAIDNMLAADE